MKGLANLVFSVGCAVLFLHYAVKCVRKFVDSEIGTRVDYVSAEKSDFPAFTLCWKHGYKVSVLRSYDYQRHHEIVDYGHFPSNMTRVEFMNMSRFALTDFLETVVIQTFSRVRGRYENVLYQDDGIHDSVPGVVTTSLLEWTPVALKYRGLCQTAEVPAEFARAGVARLTFVVYLRSEYEMRSFSQVDLRGWYVHLHRSGHFRRADTLKIGFTDFHLTEASVSLSQFVRADGSSGCSAEMDDGYDGCWEESINKKIREELGCLFPWNYKELRSEHEEDLCKNETHYRTYVEEAASAEMMDPRLASCDTPCYTMPLSLLSSHETRLRDSSGYTIYTNGVLTLHFNARIETVKEYYVYEALSMVAEAGGYLGLFLGMSCLQILQSSFGWLHDKVRDGGYLKSVSQKCAK